MATWTDSRNVTGTVATTSQTQLGSDINVPSNQSWRIFSIFGAHSQGGTLNDNEIGDGALGYPQNTTIKGPAVIKLFVTNASASSGTGRAQLNMQVTA